MAEVMGRWRLRRIAAWGKVPMGLFVALCAAALTLSPLAHGGDDLEAYRERFRAGMERYTAGAMAEAIAYWEPVYRELGPSRAYRLAYNLGRAHDALGDSTRAAERYEAFLAEVEARRSLGEGLDDLVQREDTAARQRLATLAEEKGRIHVPSGPAPATAQVDGSEPRLAGFTAYVAPGRHVVIFQPGSPRSRRLEVNVKAGERVSVTPPAAEVEEPVAQRNDMPPVGAPTPAVGVEPLPRASEGTEARIPPYIPYVTGGAAVVAGALSAGFYARASGLSSDYDVAPDATEAQRLRDSYGTARSITYVSLAAAIGLTATTVVLLLLPTSSASTTSHPSRAVGTPFLLRF